MYWAYRPMAQALEKQSRWVEHSGATLEFLEEENYPGVKALEQ